MNRRNIFSLSVITTLGFALLSGSALANKSRSRSTYRNLDDRVERQRCAGRHQATNFRPNPKGILILDFQWAICPNICAP